MDDKKPKVTPQNINEGADQFKKTTPAAPLKNRDLEYLHLSMSSLDGMKPIRSEDEKKNGSSDEEK